MITSPLHPSMVARLDPEYVAFYNEHLANAPGLHQVPWSPSIRQQPAQPGGSAPLPVGAIQDIQLETCMVRVFTPDGLAPDQGWPVFLFFHGGGWTMGNIDAENSFATNVCKRSNCVVVSVDYRLAPENPYPAAVQDAECALVWLYGHGAQDLGVDISKLAIGGSSSGGNLAAIVTQKAASFTPPIPIIFQVLIVPVTDLRSELGATMHASWDENRFAASLTPEKMTWFRNNYAPDPADWEKPDVSPLLAPGESFKGLPSAWVAVCELDILRDEGIAYAQKLKEAGVEVTVKIYERAPHPIMANDRYVLSLMRRSRDWLYDSSAICTVR